MEKKTPPVEEPLVTSQDLDLEILEDEPRNLRVPVNYYRVKDDGELGDFVSQEWLRYPIRSQLPIPTMTSLLRLEARINEAMASDDDAEADGRLQEAITDAYRRIVSIIVERTPRAFRELETELDGRKVMIRPEIELDTTQILATLAWISGDNSVADAVARTVTAGRSTALNREELEDRIGEALEEGSGSDEASPDVPFLSSAS